MPPNVFKFVGRQGQYEIYKVSITKPAPSKKLRLGVSVRSKEWLGSTLLSSFPTRNEYTFVHEIKKGSLAEEAGVRVSDILCASNHDNSAKTTGIVHDLLLPSRDNSSEEFDWSLMPYAEFEALLSQAENAEHFEFYVARQGTMETLQKKSKQASSSGPVLNSDITLRAQSFKSLSEQEQEELLDEARANARLHFEAERDAVLDALPEDYKKTFWEIGFSRWGRSSQYLPVLILDPYHVPPGKARESWLKKFQARKEKSTLDKMNYLVYWYGEALDNPNEGCYSIIAQEAFIPWPEAEKKNMNNIPKKGAARKMESLRQVNEAARLSASKRKEIIPEFKEFCDALGPADLAQLDTQPTTSTRATRRTSTASVASAGAASKDSSSRASAAQKGKRRSIPFSKVEWEEKAEIEFPPQLSRTSSLKPSDSEKKEEKPAGSTRTTRATRATRASHSENEEMLSLPFPTRKVRTTPRNTQKQENEAPPAAIIAEPRPIPASRAKPVASKNNDGEVVVLASPLLRKRSPPRQDFRPRKRPTFLPKPAKVSTLVSSSSESIDDSTSSLDDHEHPKSVSKPPATKTQVDHTTSGDSSRVQNVLDTFCQQIQDMSRRNQILKSRNEQLQSTVKNWKEQYNALAGVTGKKKAAQSVSPDGTDGDEVLDCGVDTGSTNYFSDMHIFVGQVAKQNARLERENALLEGECGELQSNFLWLVDSVKSSVRKK